MTSKRKELRERKKKMSKDWQHSHLGHFGFATFGTMDELTPLDTPSESQAGYGDAKNLYYVIDRDKSVGWFLLPNLKWTDFVRFRWPANIHQIITVYKIVCPNLFSNDVNASRCQRHILSCAALSTGLPNRTCASIRRLLLPHNRSSITPKSEWAQSDRPGGCKRIDQALGQARKYGTICRFGRRWSGELFMCYTHGPACWSYWEYDRWLWTFRLAKVSAYGPYCWK